LSSGSARALVIATIPLPHHKRQEEEDNKRTCRDLVLGVVRAAVLVVILVAGATHQCAVQNVGLRGRPAIAVSAGPAGSAAMVRGLKRREEENKKRSKSIDWIRGKRERK